MHIVERESVERERETGIEEVQESADDAAAEGRVGLQNRHRCVEARDPVRMIRGYTPSTLSLSLSV